MKIKIYPPLAIHEIGQRANQEDALWPLPDNVTTDDRLFIVCDGMGGHEKGEVASQTVSQSLGKWFQEQASSEEAFTNEQLKEALAYAYEQLDKQDDGSLKKMGTTLTLVYFHRNGITAAHIGDSRIYHIRPIEGLKYISRDHSLVFDLYQAGEITYEEMQTSPQKNIITRAMQPGEENRVRPDIIQISDIRPGDYFYLCSDGMLEQMSDAELAALLSSKISDEDKRQQLIRATANNSDNHTAWLIHVREVVAEGVDEQLINEEPISRCNALNIVPPPNQEVMAEADVKVIDNDDVVVVSELPRMSSRYKTIVLWILVAIVVFLIAFIAWLLLGNKTLHRPKPMSPDLRDSLTETITIRDKDFSQGKNILGLSNDTLSDDTAGNQ